MVASMANMLRALNFIISFRFLIFHASIFNQSPNIVFTRDMAFQQEYVDGI